jgi:hypothetical protein
VNCICFWSPLLRKYFILYKSSFILLIMKILKKPHSRFEVITVVMIKTEIRAMRPFSLVYWYHCFRGSYCLYLQASDYPACSSKFLVLVYMASYPRKWNLNSTHVTTSDLQKPLNLSCKLNEQR